MLNETNLECFLTLAETLSFTETARRMYLTQQAVSKNILNLESDIGFPLFVRTGSGVTLTREGAECREMFSRFHREYTGKVAALRKQANGESHFLRVGYQNYVELIGGILGANNAFGELMPHVRILCVRHSPGELSRRLMDGDLDLIVECKRYFMGGSDFNRMELFSTPAAILVSQENPRVRDGASYKDFVTEPYIVDCFDTENQADFNRRVMNEINVYNLRPSEVITVPNRDSAYSEAELGRGIILGSKISQTVLGSRLLRYPAEKSETFACFWPRQGGNTCASLYAEMLKEAYGHLAEDNI